MRTPINFVGGTNDGRIASVSGQRTVNLFPVVQKPGAKVPVALYSTPGLASVAIAGIGPGRSDIVEFARKGYLASRGDIIEIDTNFATSTVGSMVTTSGRVSIAAGRDYMLVVDGTSGYTFDGTTFAEITDPDFPFGATHAAYLDGYFIVNDGLGDQAFISALEDPTSWAALDFTSAESDPDDVLAIAATRRDLYLVGSDTTEVLYNSGNVDFPFEVYPNGVLEWGTDAPHSIAKIETVLCFLGRTEKGGRVVVMLEGFQVRPISPVDINWTISQFTVTDDAIGFAYKQAGETFYALTFPSAGRTLVYHFESAEWHDRETIGFGRWRANGHGYIGNQHLVCDQADGTIYKLDFDTYTDGGLAISRRRRSQVLSVDRRGLKVASVEIEFEAGVGTLSGQGHDPQAMLRYSKDGGRTWSNEMWAPIGKRGKHRQRAAWYKLGQGRQWIFEVVVTDPVPVTIIAAYANVTPLRG